MQVPFGLMQMPFVPGGNSYMTREVLTAWVEEGTSNELLAYCMTGAIMEVPGMLGTQERWSAYHTKGRLPMCS